MSFFWEGRGETAPVVDVVVFVWSGVVVVVWSGVVVVVSGVVIDGYCC